MRTIPSGPVVVERHISFSFALLLPSTMLAIRVPSSIRTQSSVCAKSSHQPKQMRPLSTTAPRKVPSFQAKSNNRISMREPNQLKTLQRSFASSSPSVVQVTTANFSEVVEKATKPVVLDCFATWCGPCRILGPNLEKSVAKTEGAVQMAVVDVDENPEIAEKLDVSSIPAVFAFHNGKIVDKFIGALPPAQLDQFVDRLKARAK